MYRNSDRRLEPLELEEDLKPNWRSPSESKQGALRFDMDPHSRSSQTGGPGQVSNRYVKRIVSLWPISRVGTHGVGVPHC